MTNATNESGTARTGEQDATATARVFAIPELLEGILIHLLDDEAHFESKAAAHLIITKRVSKTFKNTIDDSKKLQHLAFLDQKPSALPNISRIERPNSSITPHEVGINNSIRMLCEGKVFQSPHRREHREYFRLTKMTHPLPGSGPDIVKLEFCHLSMSVGDERVSKYMKPEASCLHMRIADPEIKVHVSVHPLQVDPVTTRYDLAMLEPTVGWVKEGALLADVVNWLGLWAKGQVNQSDEVAVYRERRPWMGFTRI